MLAAALALTGSWPPATAATAQTAAGDPSVGEARAELDRARATLEALNAELDAAARSYEHAAAQHLRLGGEVVDEEAALRDADEQLASAREALAARAAEAYRRPGDEVALGEAVLVAPDAGTALHRVALMETLGDHDPRVDAAAAQRRRAAASLRQHRIIEAGTAASAGALQDRTAALLAAVDDAQERLGSAHRSLTTAEAAARRQAEQARAARAVPQTAQAAQAAAGAVPAPGITGQVCPIGVPNGFIDSWGFPRSGGRSHEGVDIFATRGTPLYAVADGTVRRLGHGGLGGLSVHLLDDAGTRYYYAHLDTITVEAGQRVEAGQVVGTVGNTGNARTTPAHLHWQVHPGDGPPVNPYPVARALCRG